MSSLKIEERFSVSAPTERVWQHLLDPERIVVCLPGAELLEVETDRKFHGQMKVKVGPVTVAYKGTIDLTEVEEETWHLQMVGQGKEKGGAGSAKMTMTSKLVSLDNGGCDVMVEADVQLAGRIVRFGRGMIQGVSAQLFKQFATNVRTALESEVDQPAAPAAGEIAAETAAASGDQPAQAAAEPAGDTAAVEPAAATASASQSVGAASAAVQPTAAPAQAIAPREAEPINAFSLLFRALWESISGFFKRLFKGKSG